MGIHGMQEVICLLAQRIAWAKLWKVSVDTLMAAMDLVEISDSKMRRIGRSILVFVCGRIFWHHGR